MRLRGNAPFERLRDAVSRRRLVSAALAGLSVVAVAAPSAASGLSPFVAAALARPEPGRGARPPQSPPAKVDGLARFLQTLEDVVRAGNPARYLNLLAPDADKPAAAWFAASALAPGATRAAIRERDRVPLAGSRPGEGFRLAVDVMTQFGRRAQLATWSLDLVAGPSGTAGDREWAIKAQATISSFGPVYNLALAPREYAAKDLVITAEDFELRLPQGSIFVAETEDGPTALVLLGRGQVIFRPGPVAEREQLRIFADAETLDAPFTAAFVRVSPYSLERAIARGSMVERAVDPGHARDAAEVFRQDNPKSFGMAVGDLSDEEWSLVPGTFDFIADVHTKRFGVLTYARSPRASEDISLFDRVRRLNISVYTSQQRLARRGPFYDDDDEEDYEVIHYDIAADMDPARQAVEAVAMLTVRVRAASTSSLTVRLADSLAIQSVVSREFGRLVALRIRNQNSFIVNLPKAVKKGDVLGFTISYRGRVAPQMVDREAIAVGRTAPQEVVDEAPPLLVEPSYLYSNRSYWYPQGGTTSYATATLRLKVPPPYSCVASGDADVANGDALLKAAAGCDVVFRALQPVRYLSVLITRLMPVRSQMAGAALDGAPSASDMMPRSGAFYHDVEVTSFASPRLRNRTLPMSDRASDIVRFYASLVGDCPYPTLTLAVVERELPGGHSPGYLAVLSQPAASTSLSWRSDPTNFADFPEFFLAHEIAHQWWGQAVGWKNYHEQWLSEGLAQYFAALYAQKLRGAEVFDGIVDRMQEWAIKKSGEGPVYLGYRIGHVRRDPQLFRAVVYNKSAMVLHMLRRLLGDDAFFRGLRRFYQEWRFRKAGSDDLRRAFEAESHVSLQRFFERWIYGSRLPRIRFSSRTERGADGAPTAVLRFDQTGEVFDLPVTVTLEYADRAPVEVVVPVTEAVTEMRVPLAGRLRGIEVNRDHAAVAKIEK